MSAQSAPQTSQPPRRSWQWGAFIAAALSSIVGLGLLTLLLLPPLQAAWATEIAGGSDRFSLGNDLVVTPRAGWSVQPGANDGLLLRSPDRVLTVTLAAPADVRGPAEHDAPTARTALEAASAAGGALLTETLANGVEVRHVTSESKITAVLEMPAGAVLVTGVVQSDASLNDYRVAFAELLLEVSPAR